MGFEYNKAQLVCFFIIETSAAMEGTKIAIMNEAMRELLTEMKQCAAYDSYAIIKLAVMQFSSEAEWITPYPVDIDDFVWNDLDVCGVSNLGKAYKLLNSKLSKDEFFQDKVLNRAPIIILMSDGQPTDDLTLGLAKLKENRWFRYAQKIAVAFGGDANKDVLKDFTGNSEYDLEVRTSEELEKYIPVLCICCFPPMVGVIEPRDKCYGVEVCEERRNTQQIIEQIKNMTQCDLTSEDGWE